MTPARYESAMRGVTQTARKVLESVPVMESWTLHKVVSDLHRRGVAIDYRVVQGCVAALKDAGLVKEVAGGEWQKVIPRQQPIKAEPLPQIIPDLKPEPVPMSKPQTHQDTKKHEAPATRLGSLAAKLRALADELDDAALTIDEQIEGMQADSRRLKQLQELLKG